jgi:uncharacterized protein (TIGR02145 family)
MNTRAVTVALAAAAIAGVFGCGGKDAKDKPATAVDTAATVAAVPDTAATFTDSRDGKVYKTIRVGSQTWFAENLNYAAKGSLCHDGDAGNCAKYGRLYDWDTALTACPAGTHLPADEEWAALVDYAGGKKGAGTRLKSSKGWRSYKKIPAGTDEYGFSALSGGGNDGRLLSTGHFGCWWSATEYNANNAWRWIMGYFSENVGRRNKGKTSQFSVRCVQDN